MLSDNGVLHKENERVGVANKCYSLLGKGALS